MAKLKIPAHTCPVCKQEKDAHNHNALWHVALLPPGVEEGDPRFFEKRTNKRGEAFWQFKFWEWKGAREWVHEDCSKVLIEGGKAIGQLAVVWPSAELREIWKESSQRRAAQEKARLEKDDLRKAHNSGIAKILAGGATPADEVVETKSAEVTQASPATVVVPKETPATSAQAASPPSGGFMGLLRKVAEG